MDIQVAGTDSDVEQLHCPIDRATIDGTCAYGWYKLYAGPLDVPQTRAEETGPRRGERLAAMGEDPTSWLCSDRVGRTRSSGSKSHGEILTEQHYSLRIPRRGALEPVRVHP